MELEEKVGAIISVFTILIIAVVLLSPISETVSNTFAGTSGSFSTSTFTSTADYDAGVKAPTTDENLGVESNTDNLGIATGAFELGSLKGDAFNTVSADANTAKWDLFSSGACETSILSIGGGVLNEDVECLTGGSRAVYGSATITGDWDVSVKLDKTVDTGTTNQWRFGLFSASNSFCGGIGEDGVLNAIVDGNIQAYTCINTVFLQVGTNTAVPSDPVWLRMTRATNTFTWFYSTDGVIYTQDEQTTSASIPNPLIPYIDVYADSAGEPTGADWDDYRVNTGTVGAGGFRTTGSWTSASQTSTGSSATVTITYSGASATNYIDYMALYEGVTQLAIDNTDRTSGTSASTTFIVTVPTGWSVRIGLAGGGGGTPTMEQVVVEVESEAAPRTDTLANLGNVLPLIYAIGIVLFALIAMAAWWRTMG